MPDERADSPRFRELAWQLVRRARATDEVGVAPAEACISDGTSPRRGRSAAHRLIVVLPDTRAAGAERFIESVRSRFNIGLDVRANVYLYDAPSQGDESAGPDDRRPKVEHVDRRASDYAPNDRDASGDPRDDHADAARWGDAFSTAREDDGLGERGRLLAGRLNRFAFATSSEELTISDAHGRRARRVRCGPRAGATATAPGSATSHKVDRLVRRVGEVHQHVRSRRRGRRRYLPDGCRGGSAGST